LPVGTDHVGRGAAEVDAESDRRRHRPRHGGQHLPLRYLPAHPCRDPHRGEGACVMPISRMSIENISVSRRSFLNGILTTGAFVVASKVIPDDLFAQVPAAGAAVFNTKADT